MFRIEAEEETFDGGGVTLCHPATDCHGLAGGGTAVKRAVDVLAAGAFIVLFHEGRRGQA
jgi:hypothetical protein